jgi:hypothetical protein
MRSTGHRHRSRQAPTEWFRKMAPTPLRGNRGAAEHRVLRDCFVVGEKLGDVDAGTVHGGQLDTTGNRAQCLLTCPSPGRLLARDAQLSEQSRQPVSAAAGGRLTNAQEGLDNA